MGRGRWGSMAMRVVDVRVMRMAVHQPLVAVRVCVRLVAVPLETVLMAVMRVVHMAVRMFVRFVRVLVRVPLADVQP